MPVIILSTADILRSKLLDSGWASFLVSRLEGPTASAKKDSMNYVFWLSLIDAQNSEMNGKEIGARFNSKAIGMITPFLAACKGIPAKDMVAGEYDLDAAVGTKVDAKVIVDTYEGQLKNDFETFLPYKAAAGQAPAF
jgi:hypothetical protein